MYGPSAWLLLIATCLVAGCGETEQIRTYEVPKRPHWKARIALETPDRNPEPVENAIQETILAALLPKGDDMLVVKLRGESKLAKREKENFLSFVRSLAGPKHEVPDGWQQGSHVPFATVSLKITEGDREAKITVSPMPAASVELVPNVNRWRGQVGLSPASKEEIDAATQEIKIGDVTAKVFELVRPERTGRHRDQRPAASATQETILVALLAKDDDMLVVKLRGESKLAESEKENFLSFLRSLAGPKHEVPDGWQQGSDVPFATISLKVTEGKHEAKITVSPMPTASVELVPNVNRWRGQVGLSPASKEEIDAATQEIEVGEATAKFFEIVAPKPK